MEDVIKIAAIRQGKDRTAFTCWHLAQGFRAAWPDFKYFGVKDEQDGPNGRGFKSIKTTRKGKNRREFLRVDYGQ